MKEIFEKLKGSKLYVSPGIFPELQEILFEIGFEWVYEGKNIVSDDKQFIFLNYSGKLVRYDDYRFYKISNFKEINPFDIIVLRNEFLVNKFKGTKVFVSNKDISTKVQKRLLELGFHYQSGSTETDFVDAPFLYIENDCSISAGSSFSVFKATIYKEIYVNEIIEIKR